MKRSVDPFFLYILPDPLSSFIGRCTLYTPGPDQLGKIFFVKETMSCDVKDVIYALQCNGCQEYYIGQTGDKLRSRRTVHAQQIRI